MVRFVAAVKEELGELPGTLVGVGLIAAATSVAKLLAAERPTGIILVGTAGSFSGHPPIGAVVAAQLVGLGSVAETLGLGYVPRAPGPIETDARLRHCLGLPTARVLTNLAITTDSVLARRFAADWEVEHMEAYAVAYACADAGVPFVAVLGVTNFVGPSAHAAWVLHRVAMSSAAQQAALRLA